ncbi:pseudoazurin [Oricola cellulosilytica]|uniref:Pseudoazurin n=2 Tax=Oricola cellulosilytica TaxID=1429082 RepID=A0A4R0PBZ5_9HYPH|nr:pseudoazurin [Oricola cellulosilytica]
MRRKLMTATLLMAGLTAGVANAAEIEVQMLNKGDKGGMVFQPDFVVAEPGDSIKFVSVDKGHNAESIEGMLPDGVESFKSGMSKDFVLTVEKDGLYGIKCTPHYGMGMVALITVGEPANEDAAMAVKQKGKAKSRFEEIFAEYEAAK